MGMKDRIKKTAKRVDQEFADRELELLAKTKFDQLELSPEITSHAEYESLRAAINKATAENLNTAQLKSRIESFGTETKNLLIKIVDLIK
ncbi:hypothetical protein A8139_06760 [Marinomonas primoryensis]|uniref:Uncharacterized protein n=1 Tax=Marinomonas primoryensis TaxID=178399 RepID=A0A2Z4PQ36_9GAMM|nr:hypothetical protein [Marinomonas primoryensis]AWX99730.1 hypothetical protein A8139_06760 [Marinomonas primoryensis]|tara:strand:- start:2939 stop:3208 length:270 start_codon:yes stop_codon:yes gene_type:complete